MSTQAQKPKTTSTSPNRCQSPACAGRLCANCSKNEVAKVCRMATKKSAAPIIWMVVGVTRLSVLSLTFLPSNAAVSSLLRILLTLHGLRTVGQGGKHNSGERARNVTSAGRRRFWCGAWRLRSPGPQPRQPSPHAARRRDRTGWERCSLLKAPRRERTRRSPAPPPISWLH